MKVVATHGQKRRRWWRRMMQCVLRMPTRAMAGTCISARFPLAAMRCWRTYCKYLATFISRRPCITAADWPSIESSNFKKPPTIFSAGLPHRERERERRDSGHSECGASRQVRSTCLRFHVCTHGTRNPSAPPFNSNKKNSIKLSRCSPHLLLLHLLPRSFSCNVSIFSPSFSTFYLQCRPPPRTDARVTSSASNKSPSGAMPPTQPAIQSLPSLSRAPSPRSQPLATNPRSTSTPSTKLPASTPSVSSQMHPTAAASACATAQVPTSFVAVVAMHPYQPGPSTPPVSPSCRVSLSRMSPQINFCSRSAPLLHTLLASPRGGIPSPRVASDPRRGPCLPMSRSILSSRTVRQLRCVSAMRMTFV